MKIKNLKVINMKGNLVDLEIKQREVDTQDKWLVKNFLENLQELTDMVKCSVKESGYPKNSLNNHIQNIVSDWMDNVEISILSSIDSKLPILNKYFNMTQVKYFKCLGILAINDDMVFGLKHKLMEQYFDNYKDDKNIA